MKKLITILFISIFATTIIFAKSSKKVEAADSYEDATTDDYEDNYSEEDDKNAFFGLTTNSTEKYVTGEAVSLFTFNAVNKITQQDAIVTYNLKTDEFGYGSTYMAAYYIILMNQENREVLINAYNKYLDDFENKRLNRKDKKSIKAYGKMSVTLNWGAIKASTPNHSKAKATLGYAFYNNSPYFTIQIPATFNDYYLENDVAAKESILVKYAFTKNQMKVLLESITDNELNKILPSKKYINSDADVYDNDNYSEEAPVATETIETEEAVVEAAEEESEVSVEE